MNKKTTGDSNKSQTKKQEAKPDLPEEIQSLLGTDQGIDVSFNPEKQTFSIKILDYSQRYMKRFLRDYHDCFKTQLAWDKETKSHIVPFSELEGLKKGVEIARIWGSDIKNARETWLEHIKSDLVRELQKPLVESFETDLANAKEWRKLNPELAKGLPALPKKFTPPTVKDTYANAVPGYYSNGEIRGYNRFYVAQYTGGGKLVQEGCVDRTPLYITLHNTDRFFHSRDDWNNMELVLAQRLGEWLPRLDGKPNLKCVEYFPPNAKATIENYRSEIHGTKARQSHAQDNNRSSQQSERQDAPIRRPSNSMCM